MFLSMSGFNPIRSWRFGNRPADEVKPRLTVVFLESLVKIFREEAIMLDFTVYFLNFQLVSV